MTREEAFKNRPVLDSIRESNAIDEFIRDIYDDFESRTCESCKEFNSEGECEVLDMLPNVGFGCNLFILDKGIKDD